NTVSSYVTPITATQTSGGNLNATTDAQSVTPSSGVGSFSGLFVTNAASNVTLTFSSGSLTPTTSSAITVSAGSAAQLVITQQPSPTATAGSLFAQQPVIRVQDSFGNLRTSDNTTLVSATRNLGSATLQGTLAKT